MVSGSVVWSDEYLGKLYDVVQLDIVRTLHAFEQLFAEVCVLSAIIQSAYGVSKLIGISI